MTPSGTLTGTSPITFILTFSESVTGLTAAMQKKIVRLFYCIPPGVGRIKDPQSKYYVVMRLALPRDVAMFVAANPSTMINLARAGTR